MIFRKKILIVADDKVNVESTFLMLEVMGYMVDQMSSGEAVQFKIRKKPDLILLDSWVPEMNSFEVCRQIKANPETKNIPVLMISAHQDLETIASASGSDDFLAKPFEMITLLNKIFMLIG